MNYVVDVPDAILDEIASWELPFELEEEILARLSGDLEYGHETTCLRMPGPVPVFVYLTDIPEPGEPSTLHLFQFHPTEGEKAYTLVVREAYHERREGWSEEHGWQE